MGGPASQQLACRAALGAVACSLLAGCQGRLSALDPAGPEARATAMVWHIMAWASLCILAVMIVLATAACLRRPRDGPKPFARWFLVGGGLVFPGVVLSALLAWGLGASDLRAPLARSGVYRVEVIAHQWWWEVRHLDAPGGPRHAVNQIHVPAGVPVHVSVTAADVIHGFWIPRLGGKIDAIPGRVNTIRLQADQPGVYDGVCAEFCGLQHASMFVQLTAHADADLPGALQRLSNTRVTP